MSSFEVEYIPLAAKDLAKLDNSQARQVRTLIERVAINPLPKSEGGYGEPLGHKQGLNLTGLLKIKLKRLGIRVVYQVVREGDIMRVIVVAARADNEVYEIAAKRVSL